MTAPTVGDYLYPVDAILDQLDTHVHRNEGCVWGVERLVDDETGELTDFFHTVRVAKADLAFSALPARRVGRVDPPSASTIDGILRLAGKILTAKGRHVEKRVAVVVHVLEGVARNMPDLDVPSIFQPIEGADPHPEEDYGWQLREARVDDQAGRAADAAGGTIMGAAGRIMLAKLDAIAALDPGLIAEVRRQAREANLPYLDADCDLTLQQAVAYDEILRRWHRTAQREQARAEMVAGEAAT